MWKNALSKVNGEKRGIIPPSLTANTPPGCGFCEVMDWIPVAGTRSEVTQKLETPVIYFYSDNKIEEVNVAVDFPYGIITEVYPQTSVNMPPVGSVRGTFGGHAEWNVTVQEKGTRLDVPFVSESNIWAPSRRVTANFVQSRATAEPENEHHIFYRGLGAWNGPVAVTSTMTELIVENLGDITIPAAWVLVSDGVTGGLVRELSAIPPHSKVSTPLYQGRFDFDAPEFISMDLYLMDAGVSLEVELVKSGLYPLEARAMVDTWSASYFKTSGVRVLYVAPEGYPDAVLPWKITPTPDEEQRVLVGRVEVMLQAEEQEFKFIAQRLVKDNYAAIDYRLKQSDYAYLHKLGRFAEAKLRNVISPGEVNSAILEDWILRELTY